MIVVLVNLGKINCITINIQTSKAFHRGKFKDLISLTVIQTVIRKLGLIIIEKIFPNEIASSRANKMIVLEK